MVLCLDLCIGLCVDPVNDNLMMIQPKVIHSNWVVILEMNSKSRMNKKVKPQNDAYDGRIREREL